ncbi:MAG: putative chemotaxis MotB protein [Pseudomonadota bacterium]
MDIWPGYVDALSTMLMMVALVLVIMMAAQFALSNALNTREAQMSELALRLQKLNDALNIEKSQSESLRGQRSQLEARVKQIEGEATQARNRLTESEGKLAGLIGERDSAKREMDRAFQEAAAIKVQLSDMVRQIEDLNKKLSLLTADLESAKSSISDKEIKIKDLDAKLKRKMLEKVEELSEYRSEFFGRLKKALGNRPDIKVVGDRFVFQSEVFFQTASADLQESGKEQLAKLADTLKELAKTIPKDINWVLNVVGHTDKRPINMPQFRSNWELSSARAISVVKFLVEQEIPAERLSATGYGEYQPIDNGNSEEAFSRNRRIELKFTPR